MNNSNMYIANNKERNIEKKIQLTMWALVTDGKSDFIPFRLLETTCMCPLEILEAE